MRVCAYIFRPRVAHATRSVTWRHRHDAGDAYCYGLVPEQQQAPKPREQSVAECEDLHRPHLMKGPQRGALANEAVVRDPPRLRVGAANKSGVIPSALA
jgi:hypothetical protein